MEDQSNLITSDNSTTQNAWHNKSVFSRKVLLFLSEILPKTLQYYPFRSPGKNKSQIELGTTMEQAKKKRKKERSALGDQGLKGLNLIYATCG